MIVDQTETVYITEFGRPVRLIEEPGLHWKWPHQSRRGFDRRIQLDRARRLARCSRDKKNLEVAWYVSWRIEKVVERFPTGSERSPTPRLGSKTWRPRCSPRSWSGTT